MSDAELGSSTCTTNLPVRISNTEWSSLSLKTQTLFPHSPKLGVNQEQTHPKSPVLFHERVGSWAVPNAQILQGFQQESDA